MKVTHCRSVRVKDESGKQVLRWTEPLIGSLTVRSDGDRIIIEKKSLFGSKTYLPSMSESVETSNGAFWQFS